MDNNKFFDVTIESDLKETVKELEELNIYIPDLLKKTLKKITGKAKSKGRASYKRQGLRVKTGRLYKGIFSSAKTSNIGYVGVVKKQAYKYYPISQGLENKPRKKKYLQFKIDDKWIKVKSVKLKPHDFMAPVKQYVGSSEMKNDMDKVIKVELEKIFKY